MPLAPNEKFNGGVPRQGPAAQRLNATPRAWGRRRHYILQGIYIIYRGGLLILAA